MMIKYERPLLQPFCCSCFLLVSFPHSPFSVPLSSFLSPFPLSSFPPFFFFFPPSSFSTVLFALSPFPFPLSPVSFPIYPFPHIEGRFGPADQTTFHNNPRLLVATTCLDLPSLAVDSLCTTIARRRRLDLPSLAFDSLCTTNARRRHLPRLA